MSTIVVPPADATVEIASVLVLSKQRVAPVRLAQAEPPKTGRGRKDWLPASGLTAVVLVLLGWNITGFPSLTDDEGTYLAQAWAVQHGLGLAHYTYWYDHPPLGWIQLAGLSWLPASVAPGLLAVAGGRLAMLVALRGGGRGGGDRSAVEGDDADRRAGRGGRVVAAHSADVDPAVGPRRLLQRRGPRRRLLSVVRGAARRTSSRPRSRVARRRVAVPAVVPVGLGQCLLGGSNANSLLHAWLYYDAVILVGGIVATVLALFVRKLRAPAVAAAALAAMAVRPGGYLPAISPAGSRPGRHRHGGEGRRRHRRCAELPDEERQHGCDGPGERDHGS